MSLFKGNHILNAGDSRSSRKLLSWIAITTGVLCLMLLLGAVGVPPVLATDGCFRQKFENVEVFEGTSAEARALVTGSSSTNVSYTVYGFPMLEVSLLESEASADLTLCPMSDDDLRSWLDQEGPFYFVNDTGSSSIVVIAVLDVSIPHG